MVDGDGRAFSDGDDGRGALELFGGHGHWEWLLAHNHRDVGRRVLADRCSTDGGWVWEILLKMNKLSRVHRSSF